MWGTCIRPVMACLLVLFSVVIVFSPNCVRAENGTLSTDSQKQSARAIDDGMRPLYAMTNGFLNFMQRKKLPYLLDALEIKNVSQIGKIYTEAASGNWRPYVNYVLGYCICIALGVLFVIIMPIVGCCMCCCRCCGRCGGRVNPKEGKNARCMRIVCGVVLALLNTVMLAGMVCAFVTNELIKEQTSTAPRAVVPTIQSNLYEMDKHLDDIVDDVKGAIHTTLDRGLESVLTDLENVPSKARDALSNITDAQPILDSAGELATALNSINASLGDIDRFATSLTSKQSTLRSDLTTSVNGIKNTLSSCTVAECSSLSTTLDGVKVDVNFEKVDSVEQQLRNITGVLDRNFTGMIHRGMEEFKKIDEKVKTETESKISEVRKKKKVPTATLR